MTTLRALKKLLLGETWILPLGLATVLVATALLRHERGHGLVLLAGVVLVLGASVMRGARRR
jgi:hypothetical protein